MGQHYSSPVAPEIGTCAVELVLIVPDESVGNVRRLTFVSESQREAEDKIKNILNNEGHVIRNAATPCEFRGKYVRHVYLSDDETSDNELKLNSIVAFANITARP
jgi:hypothetical protein